MDNAALIVDVSNLAYRSAYGHRELMTAAGKFSGHVFGAAQSLLSFLRNELKDNNTKIMFCYDGVNSKGRRRILMPEYKANRIPHEINPLPEVRELLKLWPGIHIEQDDMEGDDAICYCVKMRQNSPSVVLTGDKDLWQLMQYPGCRIYSPNLKRFIEPADLLEHYHLNNTPERIPLAKSLFGDASDNVAGVFRLQKKQVEPILNAENVLTPEDFYVKLGDTKPSFMTEGTWNKLREYKDKVFLNYKVVLPQLDFKKESVTKIEGAETIIKLKQKLIDFECFSIINQFPAG